LIDVGTGITYSRENLLLVASLDNVTVIGNEEWFTVNQHTGSDVYTDKETGSGMRNIIWCHVGAEVGVTRWLDLRAGLSPMYGIESKDQSSYTYTGTTETARDTGTRFTVSSMFLASMGISLHFSGFTLDWLISDTFIRRVLGQGGLPYIISGNTLFDQYAVLVSLRYNF